jgi:DNA-binding CsgD family transcriptional regulator
LLRQGQAVQTVCIAHTTAPGAPIAAALAALQAAFAAPPYWDQVRLELAPLCDPQGRPLPDVDTPQAGEAALRLLYRLVRQAKLAGQSVHLSIAGGRKTWAVFGMAAAQMLFDADDCLWHLYSGGEFLASQRLHPQPGDEAHLIPIPVIPWSQVSPLLAGLGELDDPFAAAERIRSLQINARIEQGRAFALGALTPAERRVALGLVQAGLSDEALGAQLSLSPRTVEQHLRAVYQKAAYHWELPDVGRAQLVALLGPYAASAGAEITGKPA